MIDIIAWLTHSVLPTMKQYKKLTKINQSTQTHCKASTQGVQTSMQWIWVNAKCRYVILISIYRKKSNCSKKLWPETSSENNNNARILCT